MVQKKARHAQNDTGKGNCNVPVIQKVKSLLKKNDTECCLMASSYTLELLCQINTDEPELAQKCSCVDYMLCKLVVVTALSSNHFKESHDFFGSVYNNFPALKIIVYNIGLTTKEIESLQSYCNVLEVRDFKFDQYPSYTRNLGRHAWKPFLLQEMTDEFELFLYCDASCRIEKMFISYLPNLLKYPIFMRAPKDKWSILRTTHESMVNYLVPNLERSYLLSLLHGYFESNAVLIWSTNYFKKKIMAPLLDCAMHLECITPPGSRQSPCDFKKNAPNGYAGCNREQSSLNLILMRELGPTVQKLHDDAINFIQIVRQPTESYHNSNSKRCGILRI